LCWTEDPDAALQFPTTTAAANFLALYPAGIPTVLLPVPRVALVAGTYRTIQIQPALSAGDY